MSQGSFHIETNDVDTASHHLLTLAIGDKLHLAPLKKDIEVSSAGL